MPTNNIISNNTFGDNAHVSSGDKNLNVIIQQSDNSPQALAEENHKGIQKLRTPGTCEWLLRKPAFVRFINLEKDSILWIHGAAGCGKSTLMQVSNPTFNERSQKLTVVYDQKENQPYSAMMETFIQQAQGNKKGSRPQNQNDETDENKLSRILNEDQKHVYIVVDAVDQLPEIAQSKLMGNLNTIFQERKDNRRKHRLAIIISSRSRDGCIELQNHDLVEIQVKPDDNSDDIRKYLKKELPLNRFKNNPKVRDQVLNDIANKSNGLFLWAKLQTETLPKMVLEQNAEEFLRENIKPIKMDQVYERYAVAFKALSGKNKRVALRTMAFLANSAGSMSKNLLLEALNVTTSIGKEAKSSTEVKNSNDNLYGIVQICNHLIEIDEKQGVFRFCHASAFEFFREHDQTQAHKLITQVCLAYLCSRDISHGYDRDAKWYNGKLEPIIQKHPFLEFASCNWANSYKESAFKYKEENKSDRVVELLRRLLGKKKKNFLLSFQIYMLSLRDELPGGISHEHIISFLGLADLLDFLNDENMLDLKKVDEEGLSAIHWAIRKGVKQEAVGDFTNTDIRKVVEKLIKCGGRVDASDKEGRTPLHYAARYGLSKVVELLKDKKANLNIRDKKGQTALIAACKEHHEVVINMLVEAGADFRSQSSCGTALQILCLSGCCKCVELIFGQYEAKDRFHKLYPHGASSAFAKRLLSRYYMTHFGEGKGTFGTSLHAAAFHGREDVVELLLKTGKVYAGATHHIYGSALTAAAAGCNVIMKKDPYEKIFSLLIAHGVDVNDETGARGPALRAAALNGHIDLVKLLLDNGAKDLPNKNSGETTYQAACKGGHADVMDLLQLRGFDTTAKGNSESTSSGTSHLRQEFFKVAFTIADKDNIGNLVQKAETYMCDEIAKGELSAKLSMMLGLGGEVFNDIVKLATGKTHRGELQTTKKHILAEAWEECVSLLCVPRRGPRRDRLRAAVGGQSTSSQVTPGSSSPVNGLNGYPAPSESQNPNEEPTSKTSFLRKKKPLFNTDNFDFTGTLDLMTRAGVAILQKAIETDNIEAKNEIAYTWVDGLNNLMTSNADGESLLKTVMNSRIVEFKASVVDEPCLVDLSLGGNKKLSKAQALSCVAIEMLLVTFRNREFERLSLILSNLYNSAINDLEDLGDRGHQAVRDLLQGIANAFSDALYSGDQFEVRVCADAGVEVLKQAALSPKKGLLNAYADEWVRQINRIMEKNMTSVIHDIIKARWKDYQTFLEKEEYDQVLSLRIIALILLRAAFEQELNEVIEVFMPTVEMGFNQTMESFRGNTVGLHQDPSRVPEREFSEERRHIYETIVEEAFRLFSIAESKESDRLDTLAEMIVAGIQDMSTEARDMLEEVIVSHVRAAENGTNIMRREIALTVNYFLAVAGNARAIQTEQFSLWITKLIQGHKRLLGFEGRIIRGTQAN
ncbi:hypothetical protein TrVFT333_001315 [Trichoderma virens FT-333]|nr:hypothetical protein TrVFT333_001315 [Trichoderma virens FT-333]